MTQRTKTILLFAPSVLMIVFGFCEIIAITYHRHDIWNFIFLGWSLAFLWWVLNIFIFRNKLLG